MHLSRAGLVGLLVMVASALTALLWLTTDNTTTEARDNPQQDARHENPTNPPSDLSITAKPRGPRPANSSVHPPALDQLPTPEAIEAEREDIYRRLVMSGPSVERWKSAASSMLEGWGTKAPGWVREQTKTTSVECYRDGCIVFATHKSNARSLDAIDEIGKVLAEWPGARIQTAPQPTASGKAISAFILLTPFDDAPIR